MNEVTRILAAIQHGDLQASEELLPVVYGELRKLAEARLAGEQPGQTLQATALVHEAYLRLIGDEVAGDARWDGRGHFFAAAAQAMRRILIERARAKRAIKRGGTWQRASVDLTQIALDEVPAELVDLDEALKALQEEDAAKARLVELRFFAGLTMQQAAAMLGISVATAGRHWSYARAWLFREMRRIQENSAKR